MHAHAESRALFQYYLTLAEGLAEAGGKGLDAVGIPKEWVIGCGGGQGDKADCARVALAMAAMAYPGPRKGITITGGRQRGPAGTRTPPGLAERLGLTQPELESIRSLSSLGSSSRRLTSDPRAAGVLRGALDKMNTYQGAQVG